MSVQSKIQSYKSQIKKLKTSLLIYRFTDREKEYINKEIAWFEKEISILKGKR